MRADGLTDNSKSHEGSRRSKEASSPMHNSSMKQIDQKKDTGRSKLDVGQEVASVNPEMPDHYIYVAYPPELKRRLLERYLKKRKETFLT